MAVLHPSPPFDELTYYPLSRWVRGMRQGATVVDSRNAIYLWAPGKKVPVYAFPRNDIRLESESELAALGVARLEDPELDGYVTVPWDSVEHWYEENEEVFIHPRDPFVRVDALNSSRHIRVERDGHVLAESDAPILVFETGLPTRYYLPQADVDSSVLGTSDLSTGCPYKGFASYRDVTVGEQRHKGLFWSYEQPFHEVEAVAGYLAPYNERVDVIVDGELQERPGGPLGTRAGTASRSRLRPAA